MAEARDRVRWNHTFAVLAQVFNANRDPDKTKAIDPLMFYPWDRRTSERAPPPTDSDRQMLKRAFPGRNKPQD